MKRFLIFWFIIAVLTIPSMVKGATQVEIENYIIQKSLEAGFVKPGFPVGVIQVEGRCGRQTYRTGRHGLYYLPAGVHHDFDKKWNLANWKVCCDVGIQTLYKRMIKYNGNKVRVLKSYNTTGYTNAYRNQIREIEEKYNEGVRYGNDRRAVQKATQVCSRRN